MTQQNNRTAQQLQAVCGQEWTRSARGFSRERDPQYMKVTTVSSGCIYDCQHPLWGGSGICHEDRGPAECLCGAGFAPKDALGHASCVPERALVMGYLFLVAISFTTTIFLVRHLNEYRRLSSASRFLRKTAIRRRVLLSGRYLQ